MRWTAYSSITSTLFTPEFKNSIIFALSIVLPLKIFELRHAKIFEKTNHLHSAWLFSGHEYARESAISKAIFGLSLSRLINSEIKSE